VLWIQTLLIRIRILLFKLIRIQIRLFDTDPDPYCFKEVMYLKQYFLYIFTLFSFSVGPKGPNQKAYFVKFCHPVNFVVLIRVAYGSGSYILGNGSRIRIHPDPQHCTGAGSGIHCLGSAIVYSTTHGISYRLPTFMLVWLGLEFLLSAAWPSLKWLKQ
jgi:hypothetical protein